MRSPHLAVDLLFGPLVLRPKLKQLTLQRIQLPREREREGGGGGGGQKKKKRRGGRRGGGFVRVFCVWVKRLVGLQKLDRMLGWTHAALIVRASWTCVHSLVGLTPSWSTLCFEVACSYSCMLKKTEKGNEEEEEEEEEKNGERGSEKY